MGWLEILKDEMQKITQKEALKYFPPFQDSSLPYFDMRFEHVKHVEKNAVKLFGKYSGDMDIISAAVWVHDRTKFEPGNHAETAALWAKSNLYKTGFPENKVDGVVYAVSVHSGWTVSDLNTVEAKILWDADKLAHFGPAYFLDLIFYTNSQIKTLFLFCRIKMRRRAYARGNAVNTIRPHTVRQQTQIAE